MLQVKSVSKTFGKDETAQTVLNSVSLEVPQGAFVALTGRSGSGKSTLLNLIAGLDLPDSGEISINGTTITGRSQEFLARFRLENIGLVFQFFNLLPTLSLFDNVAIAGFLAGTPAKAANERAAELLKMVGLDRHQKRLPHEVSGGEIQRTAIARALMNKPKLLLADEPTGNLDRKNAESVLAQFKEIARANGTTLFVVSHDPLVESAAELVFTLVDGVRTK